MVRFLLVFSVAVFALLFGGTSSLPPGDQWSATASAGMGALFATGLMGGLLLMWRTLRH